MTEETPVPTEAPTTPPERTLYVQMTFDAGDGSEKKNYANILDHPAHYTPEQYAKEVAERVERTVLLHLGALPVLAQVEVPA